LLYLYKDTIKFIIIYTIPIGKIPTKCINTTGMVLKNMKSTIKTNKGNEWSTTSYK